MSCRVWAIDIGKKGFGSPRREREKQLSVNTSQIASGTAAPRRAAAGIVVVGDSIVTYFYSHSDRSPDNGRFYQRTPAITLRSQLLTLYI